MYCKFSEFMCRLYLEFMYQKIKSFQKFYNLQNILYLCGYLIFFYVFITCTYSLWMTSSGQTNLQIGDKILFTSSYFHNIVVIKTQNEILYYYFYQIFTYLVKIIVSFYMILNLNSL